MEKINNLIEKVLSIPHLDLNLNFDVARLEQEAGSISKFDPYQTQHLFSKDHYANNWSGASIVGTNGDVYMDLVETDKFLDVKPTALARQCPYLFEIICKFGVPKYRARLMKISPGGSLHWHSHILQHAQPKSRLTVHVPIAVPENFEWVVIHADDFVDNYFKWRSATPNEIDAKSYRLRYQPGTATVFNSYHMHNVFNYDANQPRLSLMLYVDLKDETTYQLVNCAVEKYIGPCLEPISQKTIKTFMK